MKKYILPIIFAALISTVSFLASVIVINAEAVLTPIEIRTMLDMGF